MTIFFPFPLQKIDILPYSIFCSYTYTNPILTENPNLNIEDPTSEKIKLLIENMKKIMIQEKSLGLAAPQIGENLRIFIYKLPEDNDFTVMINPILVPQEEEQIEDWESCLSLPNCKGNVFRYKKIQVTYITLEGDTKIKKAENLEARIIQHECDHIKPDGGTLYIDNIKNKIRKLVCIS